MNYLIILITFLFYLSGPVSPEKPGGGGPDPPGQQNVGSPRLLFANRKDIRLLDTQSRRSNTTIVVRDLVEATAVDVNVQTGMICWSDIEAEMIQCQQGIGSHGKKNTLVWTSLPAPEDIAMDTLTDKLYWTDSENNRIEVVCLKTKIRRVIIWEDIDQPRAINLDTNVRIMFWTDWGESPKIERSSMDGGNRKVVVDKDIFWPNGIALDELNKFVYWVDAKLHYIARVDYNGQNRRLINEDSPLHPFSLAYYNQVLYWSDWHTNSLHSIRLDTNVTKPLHTKSNINPMDIVIYEPRNDSNRFNPCANTKCSHLCILSESQNFTCACPIGVKLVNETHCNNGMDEYLIVARGQDIRRISLDTADYTDIILGFTGIKHLLAVDYWNGSVYWTDDEARRIRKGSLTDFETVDIITEEIVHPDGLAIDWVGQNLYWTDAGTDRIEVSRLNGLYRKILVSRGLNEPRAITLDPAMGLMFWSDWGKKPRIERANMDGTGRLSIIVENIFWPNGIAVDHGTIYWCDAKNDKIEMAAYDGSNRRELITEDLPHTFGFTLLGDYIYWTDWQRRTVERANKLTGSDRIVIKEFISDPMGIAAVKPMAYNYTLNPCGWQLHNCQHLCLYSSQSKEGSSFCSCASGYELDKDNRSCTLPEAFILYSNNGEIHRVSLSQSRSDVVPVKGKSPSALDYDATESRIYWTDSKYNSIFRAFMNGSDTERVIDYGVVHPEGLAIDWLNRNMYWTDMGKNRIDAAKLNGSYRRAIIWDNIEAPRAIIVQPQKGWLYWSSWSSTNPGIERSALNGSKRSMVVSGIGRAYGLAIEEDFIYWSDIDNYVIERMNLASGQRNVVLRNTDSLTFKPFSIATYQSSIYMQDTESSTILVYNMNNDTMTKIHHNVRSIQELKIYDKLKQHTTWTPCRNYNCSHICFTVQNKALTAVCACQSHYTLNDNQCEAPKQYILFSGLNHVSRYIDYDTIVFGGLRRISQVDADTEHIFVVSNGVLKKIKYPGQQTSGQVVMEGVTEFSLHGSAIYFSSGNCVNVTTKDGNYIGHITCTEETPISHVKTYKSWLYYTAGSRLERTTLNGINKQIVANSTGTIGGFDIDDDMIYFSDMDMKKIYTCNVNGENKKVLANNLGGPTSIAVMKTYVYWLDSGGGMERMDKWTGVDRTRVLPRNENLTSIVHVNTLQVISCNEECTICTGDGSCTCPYGQILAQDGKLCNQKMECPMDEFQCKSGHVGCVQKWMICNGVSECQDGSEELNCDEQCNDVNSENCKMIQCTDDACKDTTHHADMTYILIPVLFIVIAILCIIFVVVKRKRNHTRLNNHRNPNPTETPQNYPLRSTHQTATQGKSSSNSSSSTYANPLLVPHPSPATTAVSHSNCCHNYKYYYVKEQVPPCPTPTTPCSTDVCDNSDIYAFNAPPPSITSSPNSTLRMYIPPPPSPS